MIPFPTNVARTTAGAVLLAAAIACSSGAQAPVHARTAPDRYEIVNTWPHDPEAFTQGLVFANGRLYESTGLRGRSSLRAVDLHTGAIRQKVDLPDAYFAEGIAVRNGKLYQLTWDGNEGFIYDVNTLKRIGEFRYDGEGWGLTNDDRWLIMSDGTHVLRFLDPATFRLARTIGVYDNGRPITRLNELEYIRGEIYANVWQQDAIVRIDPQTGAVRGWIDLAGLAPQRKSDAAVLNGIAYDPDGDRLFVTGKLWPKLFEIRLKRP